MNHFTIRATDGLCLRVDPGDRCVQMVSQGAFGYLCILRPIINRSPVYIKSGAAYPFGGVEIEVLDFAMVEVGRQANAVVRQVRLFSQDCDVVYSRPSIVF